HRDLPGGLAAGRTVSCGWVRAKLGLNVPRTLRTRGLGRVLASAIHVHERRSVRRRHALFAATVEPEAELAPPLQVPFREPVFPGPVDLLARAHVLETRTDRLRQVLCNLDPPTAKRERLPAVQVEGVTPAEWVDAMTLLPV